MQYDFSSFTQRASEIGDWLHKEYLTIRSGQATPSLLDGVSIDVYGTRTQIFHIASIAVLNARTLLITPWDRSQIGAIESAIAAANLGVGTAPSEASIKVSFPELSGDRRVQLGKVIGEKLETARVSLRKAREEAWDNIQKNEKTGSMSEDEKFRSKEELEKKVKEVNSKLDEIAEKKRKEMEG